MPGSQEPRPLPHGREIRQCRTPLPSRQRWMRQHVATSSTSLASGKTGQLDPFDEVALGEEEDDEHRDNGIGGPVCVAVPRDTQAAWPDEAARRTIAGPHRPDTRQCTDAPPLSSVRVTAPPGIIELLYRLIDGAESLRCRLAEVADGLSGRVEAA